MAAASHARLHGSYTQAIAIVGVLSLVVELDKTHTFTTPGDLAKHVEQRLAYLVTSRPTAVNMAHAATRVTSLAWALAREPGATDSIVRARLVQEMEGWLERDVADNIAVGEAGADAILAGVPEGKRVTILTHCNTGSLATAGYGTAIGVIRSLQARGRLAHA